MLGVRILSASLLLPLLLWGFIAGPKWVVMGMMVGFAVLSIRELGEKLTRSLETKFGAERKPQERNWFFLLPLFLGGFSVFVHGWIPDDNLQAELIPAYFPGLFEGWLDFYAFLMQLAPEEWTVVALVLLMGAGAFSGPTIPSSMARMVGALTAYAYGTIPWLIVFKLYHMGPQSRFVVLVMAITWMGDTGAYFGGRYLGGRLFGKRPFAPQISPKKTWEGSVVGLLMSVLGAWGANLFYGGTLGGQGLVICLGLLGGLSAQVGDLVESFLKRFVGIKDSGTLIPGHGGFLDRVDGTFFCGPMVWLLLRLFG